MSVRPYCRSIVGYFFVFLFFEKKNYPHPLALQKSPRNSLSTTCSGQHRPLSCGAS